MNDRVESELEGRLARVESAILGVAAYRQDRVLNWGGQSTGVWVGLPNPEILEPGIWELRACKRYIAPIQSHPEANTNCSKCGWSELYTAMDGVQRRRCRFNAPDVPCVVNQSNLWADGTMDWDGAAHVYAAYGTTPTIAKSGGVLRITQSAAAVGWIAATYVPLVVSATSPRLVRVTGRYRNDGGGAGVNPQISNLVASATGTNDGLWTTFSIDCILNGTGNNTFYLGCNPSVQNRWVEFDDLVMTEVDLNYGRWNHVLDTDWCSHFQLNWQPVYSGEQAWWMLGDQALVGANPWGYPIAVVPGAPGEPLDVSAPRRVLVDSNRYNKFRAAIPANMTLTATLIAPAWGAR